MDAATLGWMNMIRAIQQQEIDHWRYNNPHRTLPDHMQHNSFSITDITNYPSG